jgi:phosphoglycolate phosphatase (TIGR01487 family)
MACGKPVIGTRIGGITEQVKDGINGYLVDVDDIKSTSNRIVKLLLNEDLRKKMGQEGIKIVKETFQEDITIEKHIKLYHELLQEKSESWSLEMIKLEDVSALITDFDRTLTDETGKVRKEVIKKLKSLKKPLILVTGRNFKFVEKFLTKYPIWKCIVAENGTVIYFPKKRQKIVTKSSFIVKARELIKKSKIKAKFGDIIISTSLTNRRRVKRLLKGINRYLDYKVNVDELMILPKNVNKGSGVKLALSILDIDPEKTIIVGDGENDVDLFNIPGFRVAVANAHKKLKSIADQVSKNSYSEGLIEIINKLNN